MWDSPASIYNHKNTNISNILLLHDCSWIVIAYLVHDISQQMKGPSWPFIDWRERGKKPWFPLFTEILYWQKSSCAVLARRAKRQWKLTHSSSSNKLEREHDSDGEAGVLWHKQIIQEGSPQEKKKWSLVDSVKRLVHGCCPFFHALKIHPALEIPASRLADAGFWFLWASATRTI